MAVVEVCRGKSLPVFHVADSGHLIQMEISWESPLRSPWWVWEKMSCIIRPSPFDIRVNRLRWKLKLFTEPKSFFLTSSLETDCNHLYFKSLLSLRWFQPLSSRDVRSVCSCGRRRHHCPGFLQIMGIMWAATLRTDLMFSCCRLTRLMVRVSAHPQTARRWGQKAHAGLLSCFGLCVLFHQIEISVPFTWCFYSAVTLSWFDSTFKNSLGSIRHLVSRKPLHFAFRLRL